MFETRTTAPWWLRVSLRVAATRVGARVLAHTLPQFDHLLTGITNGQISLHRVLWTLGVPVIRLTTIGAKTGKERTVTVLGLQSAEKWIVIASNWGRETYPAWYHNLKTNPVIKLTYKGRVGLYVAHEATGEERDEYWRQATKVNPGLETYQQRAGDRHIPIIVLTPKEDKQIEPVEDV